MVKILADRFIPFLRGRLDNIAEIEYIDPEEFTPEKVREADALLIRTRTRCGADLLRDSNVRYIGTCTIGMDQLDLSWLSQAGITACNAPGCNAPGVAQYVWSTLLRLGIPIRGKKVAVIGVGNVGTIVAEWGRHLGADLLLCDPPKEREYALKNPGMTSPYLPMPEVLAKADIITLHTPLTRTGQDATFHLLDQKALSLVKPGAVIINAARGPVVDTQALISAAKEKNLTLIIDTWEGEPAAISPGLLQIARVATPHIAGYSLQGKQRATRMAIESLCRHLSLPLPDVSDLASPYRPQTSLDPEAVAESYDFSADDKALRADPSRFEYLRDNYDFRKEPPLE